MNNDYDDKTESLEADFAMLGEAFVQLYLQAINGVVCDPLEEPGRHGCAVCLGAWKRGVEVLKRHDEHWGNGFRVGGVFQPTSDKHEN